jgi:hypothetical protein
MLQPGGLNEALATCGGNRTTSTSHLNASLDFVSSTEEFRIFISAIVLQALRDLVARFHDGYSSPDARV